MLIANNFIVEDLDDQELVSRVVIHVVRENQVVRDWRGERLLN